MDIRKQRLLGEALKYVKKIGNANLIGKAHLPARATREASKEPGLDPILRANRHKKAQPLTASA
jgi:hypothetical protein